MIRFQEHVMAGDFDGGMTVAEACQTMPDYANACECLIYASQHCRVQW